MRSHPLQQLVLAKLRELYREPEALFWIFVFPVLLALALGVAFRSGAPEPLPVAVEDGPQAAALVSALEASRDLRPEVLEAEEAGERLRAGKVALVVVPGESFTYRYDPTRPDSRLARLAVDDALQRAQGRVDSVHVEDSILSERGSRYIDFLIPGLVGMNLMGTGMWGIGFYIVNARSKRLLKRLVATPMRRTHYLLAQIGGRLVFLVLEVGALVGFARLAFGVPLRGSILGLALLCALGGMTFAGLGLLVASRARTIEGVSGLMNLVMLPMWVLSGIFFSTSRFPEVVQPIVQALPLTAIIDGLRAVMLDGAGLGAIWGEIGIAAAWCLVSFVIALVRFRWC
jgi:ABC-type multidrug transport system permease subunit